jgi:hypothetical protein
MIEEPPSSRITWKRILTVVRVGLDTYGLLRRVTEEILKAGRNCLALFVE